MGYRVVVVGATGNVGREMMNVLAEREFPLDEIAAVASSRSQGTEVEFGDSGRMLAEELLDLSTLARVEFIESVCGEDRVVGIHSAARNWSGTEPGGASRRSVRSFLRPTWRRNPTFVAERPVMSEISV